MEGNKITGRYDISLERLDSDSKLENVVLRSDKDSSVLDKILLITFDFLKLLMVMKDNGILHNRIRVQDVHIIAVNSSYKVYLPNPGLSFGFKMIKNHDLFDQLPFNKLKEILLILLHKCSENSLSFDQFQGDENAICSALELLGYLDYEKKISTGILNENFTEIFQLYENFLCERESFMAHQLEMNEIQVNIDD